MDGLRVVRWWLWGNRNRDSEEFSLREVGVYGFLDAGYERFEIGKLR